MKKPTMFCVVALLSGAIGARAGIIFTPGNSPQTGQENVLFNSNQTGTSVTGITNQTDTSVTFSSTLDTLSVTANGQAKVTATDGAINDITISLSNGGSYTSLIINPFLGGRISSGPATVTVVANDGTFTYDYPGAGLGNGNNFLTITAISGETILSTTIDASTGFQDLEQVRIAGMGPAPVPEPTTMLLLAGGILALCVGRFRRTAERSRR